ncbi:hypothetical protein [Halomarina rubra]|uniref:NrS-1 polymerase-like HBD domain-containing protein n=1 Tax=Halomarina rubra TaxID=2071873 RepID=A0ABD6AXH1_9EURY|nr:hypothetical protein [Halomarina rubra]
MTSHLPSAETLPASLLEYDQWLCWRSEEREGAPTKVPIDPNTGRFASTTDPATWTSFSDARTYATGGDVDGIGFVFTDEDPLVGVDLDHCRVTETETIHEWAQKIIDRLDSYTEISPSGTGIHVLVRGSLPEEGNRSGNVELYESARFFTVTGARVDGTQSEIRERTEAIAAVHREHIPSSTTQTTQNAAEPPAAQGTAGESLDDTELIERAQQAANGQKFNRLWSGSIAGYDSHSEADMALCSMLAFWSGGDATQIDRLFRDSGLYRGKWDEVHFADGSTYGEKTVDRAIAGTSEFYTPSRSDTTTSEAEASSVDTQAQRIATLEQEVEDLTERLAKRRDSIDALERELHVLEETNADLREELEAARVSTVEESEPTPEESLWRRLLL